MLEPSWSKPNLTSAVSLGVHRRAESRGSSATKTRKPPPPAPVSLPPTAPLAIPVSYQRSMSGFDMPWGALALLEPVLVHELAEPCRITGLERVADAESDFLHSAHALDHRLVSLLGPAALIVQDRIGCSRAPREEHQEALLELVHRRRPDVEGRDRHAAVLVELEAGDAAECGDVLILLPDRSAEKIDLDSRRPRQRGRRRSRARASTRERAQQADGERARRTEAGSGGDVREADDLDGRPDVVQLQRRTDDRVLDVVCA